MARKSRPPLALVTPIEPSLPQPPRNLGQAGADLWARIQREYRVDDAGGIELLLLACEGVDRISALRVEIDRDGPIIRMRNGGIKEHPALKAEISVMAFVTRTLSRLGLDVEPIRFSVGHPPANIGWRGD